MFADQRWEEILKLLEEHESVSVKYLSDILKVSPVTIRTDLNYLNEKGLLVRTHGGAIALKESETKHLDRSYDIRKDKNRKEKQNIANVAIEYIANGDCIVLDASSTCYELALLISKTDLRLTIVTNGLRTANLLKEQANLTIIVIGGVAKGNSNAIEGLLGVEILKKVSINRAFVSANAINYKDGLLDFSLYEIELKKKIIEVAHETIALVDSSKFEKNSIASFATIDDISLLITDEQITPKLLKKYSATLSVLVSPLVI